MEIKEITDQNYAKTWDNFIIENSSPAAFLQSWDWGLFRKQLNEHIKYYAIYDNEELIAVALFIKRALPGGKFYLNCPKGPVIRTQNTNNPPPPPSDSGLRRTGATQEMIFELLINEIKKIAKQEKIVFFRIAPPLVTQAFRPETGFIKPKILTHLKEPENTLVLDLSHSEQELLKNMHQKTRYNIRLAEKKGVKINKQQTTNNKQSLDIFYNLIKETAKRDKINIFNKDYYGKLFNHFSQLSIVNCQLFIASYNNTPLSSIIIIGFGNTAAYLYGASSDKHRNLMPNHLIQWQAIKWAKSNNYKYYDLWGIDEKRWPGITKFKRGFVNQSTGQEINFIGTFDYVLNKTWYNLYRLGKIISLKH